MTYIVKIAIINQLGDEEHVEEKLRLSLLHDLKDPLICAVEGIFHFDPIIQRRRLARQLKSVVKVIDVVGQHKDSVAQTKESAKLLELLG